MNLIHSLDMGMFISFLDDQIVYNAIENLYKVYRKAYAQKTLRDLQKNTVDPFKFCFDTKFINGDSILSTTQNEIIRQSDKTISNAIGNFHQYLIGNINGFSETPDMTCDVKKNDGSIFAEIKNKHNTMNARSQESVFNELSNLASAFKSATCYLVEVIPKNRFQGKQVWQISANGTTYQHPRVIKISANDFYTLATGEPSAFRELCEKLPSVIDKFIYYLPESDRILSDKVFDSSLKDITIEKLFNLSLLP